MNSEHAWPELHGTPCLTLDHVERKIQDSISESRTFPYDAVSRWAESALSGDEADYIERLRRRLDKAGVEIIPSAVNKPFTGDTPELQATSTFHDDALFPGETIVAACTAAGVRRRVIGMDPIVTPAQVTLASHTVRNPELKYDGRTFIPVRVTVDREHGTVRILTYDEPISGDSRRLGRELFPDLPDRKVYETEISLRAYDRMLQRAGWKYTFDEKSGRRIWMRPEAEKEVADAIEKESRNPENKPSEPEEPQEPRQSERSEQPVAEVPAEPNRDSQAPRETSDISEAPAESDVIPAEPQQPQPSQPTSETPQKPATPPEPVELRPEDSVFIGGQEVPIMFINPDGSVETLSVLPINENSVEDNGRYYTTFPSREALEAAAEHRPDGSMRVIRDGKELAPQDQTRAPKQPESGNPAQPTDTPKQPGSNAPAEGNSDNPPREGNGGNPPREPKQGGNPPSRPEGNGGNPPREPKQGSGNPPGEPEGEGGGEPPKSDPPSQPAEPTDPKGLREAADRAQRDIDALEKQIESHRAKEPSRLSAGTTYEAKHAKWQEKMDELQDQLPPLRELVLKWRAKADRLEEEQRQAEERRIIAEGGIPEDAEGNWQFHKVTPEHTYRFLTGRQGYTADDVIATADANTDAKEPKKPKLGANAKANAEKLQDYNRRLEEFNRNRGYWQQVREIAVRHKAEAEEAARLAEEEARKAAEAARAEEIRRQEEERRRAEEEAARRAAEKGVGREITDRWNGAEKIQGIEDAIITPSGRTIRGRYVLVEEGAATPSHDPETGFAKSPGFPVDKNGNTVNDRDYERDKAAQQYVYRVAAGYDGRAVQDPVIVSRDGVVLSGNNRTMSGRIAARDNTDAGYIGHLETTAAKYGFTAEQVRSMKHPRLYFETGENLPYTAETFALFNKPEKKEMNVTERSVKLGKTISEGVFNRMAREMDAYETFAEYARSPEAVQAIKDLHAAGVIETAELPRYYDEQTGAITPEGVSLLQGALIGHVFNGNPDVVRMVMEHPAVRDSILKALVMLAENSRFSPEYSLIGDISRAIEIYHKGKEAGFRTVSESVLQHSLLEELDIPETTALVIADLLNGGKTTRLQKFLKEYNADARLADAGQLDIFSENAEPKPAEEILRQVYGHLGINPEQYERYEKLRNNGKPDEPDRPDNDPPTPSGPGGKPGGGGEPPQTPARPAGGTQQPGAGNGGLTPPAEPKDGGNPPTGNGGNPPAPEASEPTQGYGSRPDLQAQGRRRDLAVEAKHARAKLRWNQKVLQQKEQRLRKILDRDPAMVEIAEAFGDSMETMEAEARKEVRMASDEVEYARAQVEQREAELKAVRREIREGLKQLGIQEDRETDISKARQVFDRHNTDPENAALMQRAADLAQSVGVKLIFTDRLPDGAGGAYDRIGIVKLPVDFLTEDFGRRYSRNILHEVIHSVTVYALETPERDLPEGLRKGARVLKEIYAELRDDPDFKGEYGSKTALEMTAELSNPLFRAKLKAKKLWHRVVDSVKTMLGLRPGSAYDAASRALEKLLDNFDADLWREYRDQIIRERGQNSGADRAPLNSAMTTNAEEFRRLQQRAVAERGVVMPGLADKEVRVVEVPRHPFTGEKPISQARRWAKGNIVGEHTLIDSSNREVPYTISGKAIEKYLSETAIGKSANTGVHLAVLTRLPEVISESIEAEVHPDYSKNNNAKRTSENEINGDSLIHRFYGAVEVDGETFRVKTTIIENGVAQKNKPHSYEVTAVELIEDAVPQPDNHGRIGRPRFSETQHIVEDESSSGNSISAAKLLKGIEKSYDSGKFLLEESEKASESPLVRFRDSEQLTEEYGPRWLTEQQQEDGRHSTQVANTIHSYQKFGDWVRRDSQGREVSVLDASSGLGTRHLNEMGITTEDVEPYPSADRPAPTFRSYSDVDKQYDYIISNAVLNVLPEDWRRDVLRNMAVRLKPGGKMLINVRGAKSIINQGKEGQTRRTLDDPSEILVLRPDGSIRAYQKGFTKPELKEWVQKELGDAYEVEIANKDNAGSTYDTAVLVRRKTADETQTGQRFRQENPEAPTPDRDSRVTRSVPTPREARAASPILSLAVRDTRARLDAAGDPQERRELQEQLDQLLEEQDAYATGRAPQTPQQRASIRRAAETTAAALGEKVVIHTTAAGISHPDAAVRARMQRAKGWYDAATGEVHINAFNHATEADVARTMLHESIGHKALRDFYGDRFDSFLDEIYTSAEESIRRQIAAGMGRNGWNVREATEEYMASLAETVDRHGAEYLDTATRRLWQRAKTAVKRTLNRILEKAGLTARVGLTDRDLSYLLWRQYRSRRKAGALEAAENQTRLEALRRDPESFAPEVGFREEQKNPTWKETSYALTDSLTDSPQPHQEGTGLDSQSKSDAAKVQRISGNLQTFAEKIPEKGLGKNELVYSLAASLGINRPESGKSNYLELNISGAGKTTIRVSNHSANVENFENTDNNIGIVIKSSTYRFRGNPDKNYVEFMYYGDKTEHNAERQRQIAEGLRHYIETGSFEQMPEPDRLNTSGAYRRAIDALNSRYRFRDGDREAAAAPTTAEETRSRRIFDLMVDMCNRNKDNVEYRDAARKTLTGRLATVARGMRLQRNFDRAQLSAVTDTCNKMIGLEILDTDSRADLARTIKAIDGSAGKEDLEDTAYRLLHIASHSQVRMARRRLDDLSKIRGTKTGDDRIQRQAGLDPEGQATAKAFRDFRKLPEQNIQTAMARVSERIAGDGVPQSASMLAAAEMLGLRQALLHSQEDALHRDNINNIKAAVEELKRTYDRTLSGEERRRYRQAKKSLGQQRIVEELRHADALGAIADSMGDTLQASKERVRIFREAEKERVNTIHHDANCDMQGHPAHADKPARSKLVNNAMTSFFLAPTMTFDQMLRMFGKHSANGEGYLYYRFMSGPQGWQACEDRRFKSKQAKERILDRKAAEILGKDKAHWADLYKLKDTAYLAATEMEDSFEVRESA